MNNYWNNNKNIRIEKIWLLSYDINNYIILKHSDRYGN